MIVDAVMLNVCEWKGTRGAEGESDGIFTASVESARPHIIIINKKTKTYEQTASTYTHFTCNLFLMPNVSILKENVSYLS